MFGSRRLAEDDSSSSSFGRETEPQTHPDARRSVGGASLLALGSGLTSTSTPARLARATSAYGGARSQKASAAALMVSLSLLIRVALSLCAVAGGGS